MKMICENQESIDTKLISQNPATDLVRGVIVEFFYVPSAIAHKITKRVKPCQIYDEKLYELPFVKEAATIVNGIHDCLQTVNKNFAEDKSKAYAIGRGLMDAAYVIGTYYSLMWSLSKILN